MENKPDMVMKPVEKQKVKGEIPFSSNNIRLGFKLWIAAALVVAAVVLTLPTIWARFEKMDTGINSRVPFSLGNDYWTYRNFTKAVCKEDSVVLVGDSVVWGHYVASTNTLSAYLNEKSGSSRYVNAAVDGAHPIALEGLFKYHGDAIGGRKVVIQLNPLWITDDKKDLSSSKDVQINHQSLIPQFESALRCYKEKSFVERLGRSLKNRNGFALWAEHVRMAYFDSRDLFTWSTNHPYACPYLQVTMTLPSPVPVPPDTLAIPWSKSDKYGIIDPDWVPLEQSFQWQAFLRVVEMLKERGNSVFVIVGPYNDHMIKESSRPQHKAIIDAYEKVLNAKKIPNFVAEILPSELYADSSHPIAGGYAMLADQLLKSDNFKKFVDGK